MVQMSYLQNRDRLMDTENKLLVTLGGRIMEEKLGGWDWHMYQFSRCHVRPFETPWNAACQAFLSITNSWSLLKLMSIESVMPSGHGHLVWQCRHRAF